MNPFPGPRIPPGQKILVVPVVMSQQLTTKGDTSNAVDVEIPPEAAAQVRNLGPYLTGITAHTFTYAKTANFGWKCIFQWSFDGVNWSSSVDLFSSVSTAGADIQTAYTTTDNFGLHMRFWMSCRNTSGTAIETGVVGMVFVFAFQT